MSPGHTSEGELDAVVVGAGFAGMYMLHRLRELGLSVRVFEAGAGVGGTWYWNRYPGARCDCEGYYYCYSFSKELLQEWDWSSRYPAQPEILSYLDHVADRFDLRSDIQLETRVVSATYDESGCRWNVETDGGDKVSARYLITAVGCLSAAQIPDYPGLDNFSGEWHHTGSWPHEGVDFSGKRVAVVGTGSTGIQVIPEIAAQAARLTVFQRTPNFSVPARNAPLEPEVRRQIKLGYDTIVARTRASWSGLPFQPIDLGALQVPEAERQLRYEYGWSLGGFRFLWNGFNDLLVNEQANQTAAEFVRAKIRATVKDPVTAEKLIPTDYPIGTKRPPVDTNYFETYNRENVALADLRADPIEEITRYGVRTAATAYELDAIVFATGYDAITGALMKMDVRGRDGRSLRDSWSRWPDTYLGLTTVGFPNMFMITGPGSPSVMTNMPAAIEQHVEWIADCVDYLRQRDVDAIEPASEAQRAWVEHVAEAADVTLYPLADSWYTGANIPGKTRGLYPYVGGLDHYRARCDEVAANAYEGFVLR